MQINEETKAWAAKKLLQFASWRGFPQNDHEMDMRVRSFLKLVHNKPIGEILSAARNSIPDEQRQFVASSASGGLDVAVNDADWLLELINETMEYFPLPAQMRDIYTAKLPASWDPKEISR